MIKDKLLRFLFIPMLGATIPYLANVVNYFLYSPLELLAIYAYFTGMSAAIWFCCAWLHHSIRTWFTLEQNTFVKISTISMTNAFFGGVIAAFLGLIWYRISREAFQWGPYLLLIILSVLAVIVFTLIYEILYLSRERELDSKVVKQLYRERSVAEMANLKNELEPHFIFNSLNTLSHLILEDPATAYRFNTKLANVYKYFLINKDRDMILLRSEMEFIENYFYLLRLRFEDQIELTTSLNCQENGKVMIAPFALQIAVENAIKHNEFNKKEPLKIAIEMKDAYISVTNNRKPKKCMDSSIGIGLKNLTRRYQHYGKQNISIQRSENEYVLKLPLLYQNTKS